MMLTDRLGRTPLLVTLLLASTLCCVRQSPTEDGGGSTQGSLSERYPGDVGIAADPAVLFQSGFENGLAGWTDSNGDPNQLAVLATTGLANSGSKYLRAQVTRTQLASDPYISAYAQFDFPRRVPEIYWRYYARFVGQTASPHHWVRVGAALPNVQLDGVANTRPAGDQAFWFDVDATQDKLLKFYAYWHEMRSGRCNDGSATPGCAGDQGTTYYYGNNFVPAGQSPFVADQWFCVEVHAKANTLGQNDGALSLWVNDRLVGEYRTGTPRGRWLRDNFFSWGPYFQDLQAFDGFNFRTDANVLFKRVILDAYYEQGTLPASAPEAQVILFDDVVLATTRVGCRKAP